MSQRTPSYVSSVATQREAKLFNRRTVLKGSAIAGLGALAAPAVIRDALAASEINVLMWSDYLPETFLKSFKSATGITINVTEIGSNEEILNKMKASKGQGFDLVCPTNMRNLQWQPLELLQPFDMKRVDLSTVNPVMSKIGAENWNFDAKGSHWLPHIWGTEGIAWRTDKWSPPGGVPSYGDVWSEENAGKTMGRAHSMMLGAGLYMETIDELEKGDVWKAYSSEEALLSVWDKITDWCMDRRKNIKLLWNDAEGQKNGFMSEGVIVGQSWDGPPLALKKSGEPMMYQTPKEGAMTWIDGLSLPIGAKNIDEAYAFIKHSYNPVPAGEAVAHHSYNSPVLDASEHAGDQYQKDFSEAYPGDSLLQVNPWPAEPQWYADARTGFVNRFISA